MTLVTVLIVAVLLGLLIYSVWQTRTDNGQNSTFPNSPLLPSLSPVLKVNQHLLAAYWTRDSTTDLPDYVSNIQYSVSNYGNADAQNVNIKVYFDGNIYSDGVIPSLAVSQSNISSFSVSTPYDSRNQILIQASCSSSADSYTFSVGSDLPRYWSDDRNVIKLFVTPREVNVVNMKNQILKNKFFLLPNWIALRDWVGNNIKYKYDSEVHGTSDYWQLSKETLQLRTGDCEDFAILICSFLRADGWSPNDAFVVLGKNAENQYHAWARINFGILGWYNLEPQGNGWNTLIGDYLSLSGYTAECQFNDQQFVQLGR